MSMLPYAERAAGLVGSVIDSSTSLLHKQTHDIVRLAMGSPASEAIPSEILAGIAATLLVPAGWAASSLDPLYAGASTSPTAGPVGKAYQEAVHHRSALRRVGLDEPSARDTALLDYLIAHRRGEKYLLATQAAYPAERLLRAQSQPTLVMGGFTGKTPFPSADQLGRVERLSQDHRIRFHRAAAQ